MVQPEQSVPQKKGLGAWAWVAIGCGAILVLGAVGMGAVGFFVKKKVASVAEKLEKNPELAAVEMMAALNPEIEVVSSDAGSGKVTVRNKTTGETLTVDMQDLEQGKLRFESSEGNASISFDQEAGRVEIQGDDGAVTQSWGGGTKVPGWVPQYPAGISEGVWSSEDASQAGGTFAMTTADSLDDVFTFYRSELQRAGYEISENRYSTPDGDGALLSGESADGMRSVTLTLSTEEGNTRISGMYNEQKQ